MCAIRVLVAAPDSRARELLLTVLRAQAGVVVQHTCDDRMSYQGTLHRHEIDVVFADAVLLQHAGRQLVPAWSRWKRPLLVVVSRERADAVMAFEEEAVDFLLTPHTVQRSADTLARLRRQLARIDAAPLTEQLSRLLSESGDRPAAVACSDYALKLVVSSGPRSMVVLTSSIDWIAADDAYSRAYAGTQSHLLRETLGSLARRLDPGQFVRIHRSALVNIARVQELRHGPRGQLHLVLESGAAIAVSKRRHADVHRALGIAAPVPRAATPVACPAQSGTVRRRISAPLVATPALGADHQKRMAASAVGR